MSPWEERLRSQILTAFLLFSLLVRLGVARFHLRVAEVREHAHDGRARTEIDTRLLDERIREILLGLRTLARDTDLQSAKVAWLSRGAGR